jgi:antitoxin component YwqK of YwqJK toxin-antitoxin module
MIKSSNSIVVIVIVLITIYGCNVNRGKIILNEIKIWKIYTGERKINKIVILSEPYLKDNLPCYNLSKYSRGYRNGIYYEICKDSIGDVIIIEGFYKDGKRDGEFRFYFNNKLMDVEIFRNDSLITRKLIDTYR